MDKRELEQREFESKLLHAVRNFGTARMMAQDAIELAKKYGVFDGVKFGIEDVYENSVEHPERLKTLT